MFVSVYVYTVFFRKKKSLISSNHNADPLSRSRNLPEFKKVIFPILVETQKPRTGARPLHHFLIFSFLKVILSLTWYKTYLHVVACRPHRSRQRDRQPLSHPCMWRNKAATLALRAGAGPARSIRGEACHTKCNGAIGLSRHAVWRDKGHIQPCSVPSSLILLTLLFHLRVRT
jgi:hypothetical protein